MQSSEVSDEPKLNEPLFRQVVEVIRADKEHWDQTDYFQTKECGAAYCFAGWTCVLTGLTFDLNPSALSCYTSSGTLVSYAARRALGLTSSQAWQIFQFTNVQGRHPTFNEFLDRLTEVTGLEFEHDPDEKFIPVELTTEFPEHLTTATAVQ